MEWTLFKRKSLADVTIAKPEESRLGIQHIKVP